MTDTASRTVEYETTQPTRVDLDIAFGAVRLVTDSDRVTTRVTVRPASPGRRSDDELVDATQIALLGDVVTIAVPRWRLNSLLRPGAIEVLVETPPRPSVRARTGYAEFTADGVLSLCHLRSSYGGIRLDSVEEAEIATSGGHVVIGAVQRVARVSNSYETIRIGECRGRCELRNSSGDIVVGTAHDSVRIQSVYGRVTVERAVSGSHDIITSYGATDVGIAEGTAVRLDLLAENGRVVNRLAPSAAPQSASTILALRARATWGDITVRRTPNLRGDLT